MSIIIAFGHRRGVGKSTAGKFLRTHLCLQKNITHIRHGHFASKIKEVCHDLYKSIGLMDEEYYERNTHLKDVPLKTGKTPRQYWIEFGTLVAREVDPHTWLRYFFDQYKEAQLVIVQDLRFPNEADAILSLGGKVYKINRNVLDTKNQHIVNIADDPLEHYTQWSGIIDNNGTIRDFFDKIKAIGDELFP